MMQTKHLRHRAFKAAPGAPLRANLATPTVDYEGDITLTAIEAIDTRDFLGLMPYNHDTSTPENIIGKWERLQATPAALSAEPRFATHARAQLVAALVRDGMITDVSIGFQIIEACTRGSDTKGLPPFAVQALQSGAARRVIRRWRLLEASIVPIGANPDAVFDAVKSGRAPAVATVVKSRKINLAKELGAIVAPGEAARKFVASIIEEALDEREALVRWWRAMKADSAPSSGIRLYTPPVQPSQRNIEWIAEDRARVAAELRRQKERRGY